MEPWRIVLGECQDEISEITPNGHYRATYRDAEIGYWCHIPQWLYQDVSERRIGRCLDIGCAYGTLLLYAKRVAACEAYGTDFVNSYISPALLAKYDINFLVNNIELDPFPWDIAFDAIIFTEVLEHLNFHPVPTLAKIRKLLAPGGRLYLSTPDSAEWGKTLKYHRSYCEMPMPSPEMRGRVVDDHVWQFSEAELMEVLDASGFEVVRFAFAPGVGGHHFNLTLEGNSPTRMDCPGLAARP